MNPEKSKLKMLTLNDVGNKFDDMKEAVTKELSEWAGARMALKEAIKNTQSLCEHVDKDLEEDLIPTDTLPVASYVKKYIARAVGQLDNLLIKAKNYELIANGKMDSLDSVIKVVKKRYDDEIANLELYKKALELGVDPGDAGRPENSPESASADIQARREEAQKAKKKIPQKTVKSEETKKVKTRRARTNKGSAKNT